jgi:glutathione S-transferase
MILLSSAPSPFGRKVKIAAYHLNLMDRITIELIDVNSPNASLYEKNPLGKIPALILEDGDVLYDSRVIIEYLDSIAAENSIFAPGAARYKDLALNALADGMMEASLLQIYEIRKRPEEDRSQDWLDFQAQKVARSLKALEANTPPLKESITVGHITLACALGYLDFRFNGDWRTNHPNLVSWLDQFAEKVPGFDKTRPPPA